MISRHNPGVRKAVWTVVALLALNAVLFAAQPGLALPGQLASYFFGPKLVRAEVIVNDAAGLHDYRLDRGRVRAVSAGSLTLVEKDRTVVVVPVAADADITLNGRRVSLSVLRRGMTALTVRDAGAPASTVRAFGVR
jgi:hypothetical protein